MGQASPHRVVGFKGEHLSLVLQPFNRRRENRAIEISLELVSVFVYPTRSTLTLELMGRRVIGDLMDVF